MPSSGSQFKKCPDRGKTKPEEWLHPKVKEAVGAVDSALQRHWVIA